MATAKKKPKARKAATKKAATKKAATKKAATKKAATKKAATKKAATTKAATKKAATKKAATKKAATKKAATKKAAATGAMRAGVASVEAYLAKIPDSMQGVARRFQELVSEIAPDARASIKWGQPVWEHGGPLAFLRPAAKHLTLGFWRGAQLEDAKGLLEGVGSRMRHLKIGAGKQLDDEQIRRFIEQAVALNREHGDPTKRDR